MRAGAVALVVTLMKSAAPLLSPILLAIVIALDASPHTRPPAILMGPAITEEPAGGHTAEPSATGTDG